MTKRILAAAATAALAVPAIAAAQPSRHTVETTLAPGERVALTIGTFGRGQFDFSMRASGTGLIQFGVTQQRGNVHRFPVLNVPSPFASTACRTTQGSVLCRGISTPAPVAGSTYTFRVKNKGDQPIRLIFTVAWRAVASAG